MSPLHVPGSFYKVMALDLTRYPVEILENFLLLYLDRQDLWKLWLAVCGCEQHVEIVWPHLEQLTEQRLENQASRNGAASLIRILLDKETSNPIDEYADTTTETRISRRLRQQTRSLSERLLLMEYGQTLNSVIWCGRMKFAMPAHLRFQDKLEARVKLYSDENWSFQAMHAWNCHFPPSIPIVQLRSCVYNFVPVKPSGRLLGVTKQDEEVIQRIRLELEATNQVMALRFTQINIILRIISPNQVQDRLRSFPGLAQQFETFPTGLLCCWEIDQRWEDERTISRQEKLHALASTVNRYQSCCCDTNI